jgi:hypothetical protein
MSFNTIKLIWHSFIAPSFSKCAVKLCTDTGLNRYKLLMDMANRQIKRSTLLMPSTGTMCVNNPNLDLTTTESMDQMDVVVIYFEYTKTIVGLDVRE